MNRYTCGYRYKCWYRDTRDTHTRLAHVLN